MVENKEHWEKVFSTKQENEVSWFQKNPFTSLEFISKFKLSKDAKIIDVGGGDSYFIDALLELGFTNLTLLDISANAIERIKTRLGEKAKNVTFIISDVLDFNCKEKYDFWHDRASFHFLLNQNQIEKYLEIVSNSIDKNGIMVIGTFSENGPKRCSGLDIIQYNEVKMNEVFNTNFELIDSFIIDHQTPFDTIQNFIFVSFKRK
ncbi:class I SAM-dependent methyltransferase [Flavobacterium sp.]|uniref:class I SAM-dependent methyltransferase n=1 Tax=Flavobacterium sp. TaxID=239 RepID=UPI003752AF6E